MQTILETSRLRLQKFSVEDAPFMFRLLNEPTWIQYIGDRNVRSTEDAARYLQNGAIHQYKELGYGFYLVVHKESGLPIGTCGFTKRDYLDHPDFGFAFIPEYTGMGYAFEIAAAALDFAEEILQFKRVEAFSIPENKRSISLLVKLGFRFERSMQVDQEEVYLFGMDIA